jgi:hypothetical protein
MSAMDEDDSLGIPTATSALLGTLGDTKYTKQETISGPGLPNMWSRDYIGLYSQYAAVGLIYGGNQGTMFPFCFYVFNGDSNLCANGLSISSFAWSIKIVFAVITDSYRPCGKRRKSWMLFGWIGVLLILFMLALFADKLSASSWLVTLLFLQCFMMFSNVPADGLSVELAKLESADEKGKILATGQLVRYLFCILASVIQTCLLNGPSTNPGDCKITFNECWSWGLSVNEYYWLMFALIFILVIPICFLKELDLSRNPQKTARQFISTIWQTLQNQTTFYLLIFIVGTDTFTNFFNNVNIYLQYNIIKLTNFQAGIDSIITNTAIMVSIWFLRRYLLTKNWRLTQYASTIGAIIFGLLWIPAYHNSGGTMNPWYTIFIDFDYVRIALCLKLRRCSNGMYGMCYLQQYFVQGVTRVLHGLAVLPLAQEGQEATLYELVINAGNSAQTLKGILGTQLLTPLQSAACEDYPICRSDTVSVTSKASFYDTHGPARYTNYTLVLAVISLIGCIAFTPFFPNSEAECLNWKTAGEKAGRKKWMGYVSVAVVFTFVGVRINTT